MVVRPGLCPHILSEPLFSLQYKVQSLYFLNLKFQDFKPIYSHLLWLSTAWFVRSGWKPWKQILLRHDSIINISTLNWFLWDFLRLLDKCLHILTSHLSPDVRKPTFCICEKKDADQLCGNRENDQRLCFRYLDSTIPLLPKYKVSGL